MNCRNELALLCIQLNSKIAEARAEQEAMQLQYYKLAQQMKQQDEDNKRKQQEMMKIIEKKNYESHGRD